MMLGTIQV